MGGSTHEDRLRTNYNDIGVAVMQAMYSDDYLSIGGTESTDELAELAGIDATSRVLDVGCGVGGPMLHLAATIGCTVVGVDLVESSIDQAQQRSSDRGLSALASFQSGNATALPFEDSSFDVIWGQDAWCHVPDKPALLAQAHRVLRPGGTIAFTDWLAGDGMTIDERQVALNAALSPDAATTGQYLDMLDGAGFTAIRSHDIGSTFVGQYQEICARLNAQREPLIEQFGERVYEIVAELNGTILRGFEGGAIGGGRFVATATAAD